MTLVPNDLVEQAARVVDQNAFRDPTMGEPTRTRRQAAARHKAAYIIKLVIEQLAGAVFIDPGPGQAPKNEFPQPNRPRYPRHLLSRARAE